MRVILLFHSMNSVTKIKVPCICGEKRGLIRADMGKYSTTGNGKKLPPEGLIRGATGIGGFFFYENNTLRMKREVSTASFSFTIASISAKFSSTIFSYCRTQ